MRFVSTRGGSSLGFIDSFLEGLAPDGGLYVPQQIPVIDKEKLDGWRTLSFQELAFEVLRLFVDGEIVDHDLEELIHTSFSTFTDDEVVPIKMVRENLAILELFHGPTYAFKDIALQFIGNLYAYIAKRKQEVIHILAATSGDTGAAAIYGVKGKPAISIAVLYPSGMVSRVQELQMTTVLDDNVLTLAVDGNFDDCQRIVKQLFSDEALKKSLSLRAVNSINFVRIIVQMVYYIYAYGKMRADGYNGPISFSVPTGNFGNIFSAYLAKRMGLPIASLLLATNSNDILTRFIDTGIYEPKDFAMTYSPAMDIQVASNFERYLYYLFDENVNQVKTIMEQFAATGRITVGDVLLSEVQKDFLSYSIDDENCVRTMKTYNEEYGYVLDPHTACGIAAFEKARTKETKPALWLCLSTAHPAKFSQAMAAAGTVPPMPESISSLMNEKQKVETIPCDAQAVALRLTRFFEVDHS